MKNERVKALVPRQDVASGVLRGLVNASQIKGYVKVECLITVAMNALERDLGTTRPFRTLFTQKRWVLTEPNEDNDVKRVVQI
jgi:hypothetical protein